MEEQISKNNKTLYIVAADVQGLYPNLCRELIKASLLYALQKCTNYTKEVSQMLIDLTIFCLGNIVVQKGNTFYTQSRGIITMYQMQTSYCTMSYCRLQLL